MFGNSTESDDDEILVYDWKNAAVPRPAGTERLLDCPTSKWHSRIPKAVSSNYHSNNNNFNYFHERPFHRGYTFENNSGHSYTYNNDYNYRQPAEATAHIYRTTNEGGWKSSPLDGPRHEISLDTNFTSNYGSNRMEKPLREEDDDWFEIEEIDYSDQNTIKQYELNAKEVESKSNLEIRSPSTSSTLCVPKSSLPLNVVLSEIPDKSKVPLTGSHQIMKSYTRNGRKRPRCELQKNESTDLEDFFSKTKHRASARSYARPTRKVGCIDDTKSSNSKTLVSTTQAKSIVISTINNTQLHHVKVNEENVTDYSNPVLVSDASVKEIRDEEDDIEESEVTCEASLRIRTDIFEDDDE